MPELLATFINIYLKIFFVLTPFFVVSAFITMTREFDPPTRRRMAIKVTAAIIAICFFLFFFGRIAFAVFGITIDAFRVGAGALLFLSALSLVRGTQPANETSDQDITVVPLALPITVGPATTGIILVLGGEVAPLATKVASASAMLAGIVTVGVLLYLSGSIERLIGQRGLIILSKVTGIVLASISAQMIFTGAAALMKTP